jgi:hypothetical protein
VLSKAHISRANWMRGSGLEEIYKSVGNLGEPIEQELYRLVLELTGEAGYTIRESRERLPEVCEQIIRPDSGGKGEHHGGDVAVADGKVADSGEELEESEDKEEEYHIGKSESGKRLMLNVFKPAKEEIY